MGSDDDLPDYLRGVSNDGFQGQDNYTLRTDQDGPMSNSTFDKRSVLEDDLDDDTDEKPAPPPVRGLLALVAVAFFALGLLVLLIGAATAAGATVIRGAQHDAEAAGEALVQVVINEKRIVPELGARGGNRGELEELLAAVDSSSGLERSYRALAYTNAVQAQIVAIGDVRNTPIQRRQHEIDLAQDHFEGALAAWSSSAGNPLGRLAVTFGLADGPPAR
ncbi:MAG: hypothetical protein KC656_05375 [Myxococcales bacterium]|nr:hypothetical protein [Myxococcales bacterium]MCB9669937.1 hypothetical protein [Alphaproteobacteria bacterium]MCB9693189.1 hypothetical protein [Alphaproteobacteria bacterium]